MTAQKLRPGGSPERKGSDVSEKLAIRLPTDNVNIQLNAVEASARDKDKRYVLHSFRPIYPHISVPKS